MYKTLDGDLTCEACTRNQCDGEIPDGAAWVDCGECYLCERDGHNAARKALANFAAAAAALNGLWQPHADGSAIDRALCDRYPEGWPSFDEMEYQIRLWAER